MATVADEDAFWHTTLTYHGAGEDGKEWIAAHGPLDQTESSSDPKAWNSVVQRDSEVVFTPKSKHFQEEAKYVHVSICETRGEGVLDSIGGELWEAALLLCTELIAGIRTDNPHMLEGAALELGSGVGLGGFFLLQMKLLSMRQGSGEVCLTDFDHQVLRNLSIVLKGTRKRESDVSTESANVAEVLASIHKLDWFDVQDSSLHEDLYDRFDFVFGSALVYNNEMAIALAGICEKLLYTEQGDKKCKEILIVQIKDRPGIGKFMELLEAKKDKLHVEVKTVSEDVYDHALSIVSSSSNSPTIEIGETKILRDRVLTVPLQFDREEAQKTRESNHYGLIRTPRRAFIRIRILPRNESNV